jgi:hypothetical protein
MRTTIDLPDDLIRRAKKRALEEGTTLTEIIGDALREALAKSPRKNPRKRVKLITYGKGGVYPGVNLDRTSALLDRMDGRSGFPPTRARKSGSGGHATLGK